MPAGADRIIDGLPYWYDGPTTTKPLARARAKEWRNKGYLARVIKEKAGYSVFTSTETKCRNFYQFVKKYSTPESWKQWKTTEKAIKKKGWDK